MKAVLALIAALLLPTQVSAEGYRIFISVDMEGISGAVTGDQILPGGADYAQSRKIMTAEVLAAIAGAREAGATEFVIADAHGTTQNLLVDELPPNTTLIRGDTRPLAMMEGIQNGKYDGAMFIGYHAGASSLRGVRAHTFLSSRVSELKLDGVPASEGHMNARIAAQYGVPVLLVTGDDATIDELKPVVRHAESVAVKQAIGFHAVSGPAPSEVQRRIREAAARAVRKIGTVPTAKNVDPVAVELTFHFYQPAELLGWLPFIERTGARSVRFKAQDAATAMRLLWFAFKYNVALEP